jgi:electron transport complex protein RnfG
MSQLQLTGLTTPPRAWHMYRSMVGVGLLCGLLIVGVFQVTRPVIERNKAEALQRAIFRVLPDARSTKTFRFDEQQERFELLQDEGPGGPLVYAGYDAGGGLIGLAVEARGMGYQDIIAVLYGYSFAADAIIGIRVLETKETPGLGDKIEKDPEFLENFRRLDVSLTEDLSAVLHPIESVKKGKKEHPWQIDTITGATISSTAIANMLSRNSSYWIPRIRRRLDDFREAE